MSTEAMQDWIDYESYSAVMSIARILFGESVWDSMHELAWQGGAACQYTDPDIFYPAVGGDTNDAKKVCKNCEVRAECLQYALDHVESYGVWGGMSPEERRTIKK